MNSFAPLTQVKPTVLVTGGTGYIGSHTCVELLAEGYSVVIVDSLVNSKKIVLDRLEQITGKQIDFYQIDIRETAAMAQIIREHSVSAVVHFAALKCISESVTDPIAYFGNNIGGLVSVISAMQHCDIKTLVFSSSAAVYGEPQRIPLDESHPLSSGTPYGRTKLMAEQILSDLLQSDPAWRIATLRYFNPIGAHHSGLIGEDPRDVPSNLMPYVAQIAVGRLHILKVFGGDYPTHDGTGVRDYIHVVDLAQGHLAALDALQRRDASLTVNLGTGQGYSVLDAVHAFEAASGRSIPYEIVPRRPGDIAACYADPSAAAEILGWRAQYDLQRMCEDQWRWQSNNPEGFV